MIRWGRLINMFGSVPGDGVAIAVVAPFMGTVRIVFAFPDGGLVLDAVNDVPVGSIRFAAMGRSGDHYHGRIADGDLAYPLLRHAYLQFPFFSPFLPNLPEHSVDEGA